MNHWSNRTCGKKNNMSEQWLNDSMARLPGYVRCNSVHTLSAYRMVTVRIIAHLTTSLDRATVSDLLGALCQAVLQYHTNGKRSTMPHRIITIGMRMINIVWKDMYGIITHPVSHNFLRSWCMENLNPVEVSWITQNALRASPHVGGMMGVMPTRHRKHFTEREVGELYAFARKNTRDHLMITMFLTTGIRISALSSISWDNVHLDQRMVQVIEKGNKIRNIYLHEDLLLAFKDQYEMEPRGRYVFSSGKQRTRHITARHMRAIFYKLSHKSGVKGPHVHPHTCRHTLVHALWKAGNSLDRIAKYLGHESPNTTSKYYLDLTHKELVSSMIIPWYSLNDVKLLSQDSN